MMGVHIVERKYECTNGVIEKTRFPVGSATRHLPGARHGKSTVKKQTENDKQAAKRLARILNCNFSNQDLFVTLRYSDEGLSALGENSKEDAYRNAKKDVQLFLRKLKRKHPNLKYVYVTSETNGKTGETVRLHHHVVISGECSIEEIMKAWKSHGDTYIEPLHTQDDYTPLAVYLVKQGRNEPNNQAYSTSRNMVQPKITERIVSDNREIKVDPRDITLERNSYDPALSIIQYVRYKHYPRFQVSPNTTDDEEGDDKCGY